MEWCGSGLPALGWDGLVVRLGVCVGVAGCGSGGGHEGRGGVEQSGITERRDAWGRETQGKGTLTRCETRDSRPERRGKTGEGVEKAHEKRNKTTATGKGEEGTEQREGTQEQKKQRVLETGRGGGGAGWG